METWKAIFVWCILNPDDNVGVCCCLCQKISGLLSCPLSLFPSRKLGIPSNTSLWTHQSVHIINTNQCASKREIFGMCVCVKGNVKDVSKATTKTLPYIWKMTPSFEKSLPRLVGAEYQSCSHCTNTLEHRCRNLGATNILFSCSSNGNLFWTSQTSWTLLFEETTFKDLIRNGAKFSHP